MKVTNTNAPNDMKVKALLSGSPGRGKTFSARSLNQKTTLIISAEAGLLSLAGTEFDVWVIESWEELQEVYKNLLLPENIAKYKVVFVDSLTEINEKAKEHIVKKLRPGLGKDIGKVYDELMTMQDYGLLQTMMTRFIRSMRDLPYHMIFTCLEDQNKDESTGKIMFAPSLNGKLAINIAGFFDEVFRMVVKEEDGKLNRYFITNHVENSLAKDRSGSLDIYEPANWSAVFKKIFAKFGKKEDEES